jgi:hypothetical protein
MTFSTTPVVCLTLAKWETVSGQFGGYLKKCLQPDQDSTCDRLDGHMLRKLRTSRI